MRIAIFGGLGNYGLTLAALATQRGHEVSVLQFPGTIRRIPGMPQKNYEPLIREFETRNRRIEIHDRLLGLHGVYCLPEKVFRSVEDLPSDISTFIIAYPSLLHEGVGEILRHRLNGKTIITFTDRFLGGFALLKAAESLGAAKLVSVGATPLTAFEDRKDPFKRYVYSDKKCVRVAFHADKCCVPELKGLLTEVIPGDYLFCDNLLELAFNCAPSNLHAPHDLLNLVRYEQAHEFTMFHEGFTAGIENLINAVSGERCAIAEAFGISAVSFLEYEKTSYHYHGASITENRRLNPQLNQVPAPMSLYSCKGIEDVVCALVPLSDLAKLVSIPTPVIDALIEIWSCYLGYNLRAVGRTLASLGLVNKPVEEIKRIMS